MNDFLQQLKTFSTHLGKGVAELFKKQSGRNIQIRELASSIIVHPDTKKETKTLLGLLFHFYRLESGSVTFKLETKGANDEYILELHAVENGQELFSYKAYEEDHSLKDNHLLPEYVYVHLHEI
ncbi:hypothetical protein SAMN05421736_13223 [Evansella caseinilytica]|uniref:Uncharacterized protein n=1 Tax=Evansella caseinilytica TaxID=1503961 RepID=A0A1H3V0M1_9BACI|nr:hypothetical protein [Evansella caseinilytica]SDZ68204.1 hypothetical protein SAMN05421736_13223 [Evansella caseinilytica]